MRGGAARSTERHRAEDCGFSIGAIAESGHALRWANRASLLRFYAAKELAPYVHPRLCGRQRGTPNKRAVERQAAIAAINAFSLII